MWFKYLIIILLLYFFALLQNSFFAHFNLFGAVPNLVFVFFFLLVFFEKPDKNLRVIFYAIIAGLFLDVFSCAYLGASIILLIIIGFLIKKIQSLLKEKKDKHPFVYFLSLFLISLAIYDLLMQACLYFLSLPYLNMSFGIYFFGRMVYSLLFAIAGFHVYKKIVKKDNVI